MPGTPLSLPIGRRDFMARSGGALAFVGAGWPAAVNASPAPRLIIVSLDGGADGLALLPPHGDICYRRARGPLALESAELSLHATDLDGFFALHPALAPLRPFYRRGELLAIPAVGNGSQTLSHADARLHFAGWDGASQSEGSGWLRRALALHEGGRTAALNIGPGEVPLLLRGQQPLTILPAVSPTTPADRLADGIADLHRGDIIFAESLGRLGIGAATNGDFVSDRQRRRNAIFDAMMGSAGRIMADARGPMVASIGLGGWDTHAEQGSAGGRLALVMAGLADGLTAFAMACGDTWRSTVVLVATEFGRTVAPNREGGTDHGAAGSAFLMGGAVGGGRVLGRWPGLKAEQLTRDGALAPTTDLRAVFKGALVGHLGLPRDAVENDVFPGSANVLPLRNLFRT
jgi:uncharacterized protein (DUF1501 family)